MMTGLVNQSILILKPLRRWFHQETTFLLGSFLSNLGSLIFQLSFSIYAIESGLAISAVGIILGANRIAQLIANLCIGDLGDRADAFKALIATDAIGAFADIAVIAIVLRYPITPMPILVFLFLLRGLALGIQIPLRAKIGKILTDHDSISSQRIAVKLNMLSQGVTFFGAIFTLFFRSRIGFIGVCGFDIMTFLISAVTVLQVSKFAASIAATQKISSLMTKLKDYYHLSPRLFWLDALVNFPVWGTQSLFLRITEHRESQLPYCWIVYGAAVMISGWFVIRRRSLKIGPWLWVAQSVSFAFAYFMHGNFWLLLLPLLSIYLIYFQSWHLLATKYQLARLDKFAALASVRNLVAVIIISSGEFVVSFGVGRFSVEAELLGRAIFCFAVALCMSRSSLMQNSARQT